MTCPGFAEMIQGDLVEPQLRLSKIELAMLLVMLSITFSRWLLHLVSTEINGKY